MDTPVTSLRNKLSPFYNLAAMISGDYVFPESLIRAEAELCENNKRAVNDLLIKIEPKEATTSVVEYSQKGHHYYPEDTWEESNMLENEDDLYKFLIFLHKKDSRNRSNFPLSGGIGGDFIFYKEITTTLDYDGKLLKHVGKELISEPTYFTTAWNRYKALIERAHKSLPVMRKLRMLKKLEEIERHQLELLKTKYI